MIVFRKMRAFGAGLLWLGAFGLGSLLLVGCQGNSCCFDRDQLTVCADAGKVVRLEVRAGNNAGNLVMRLIDKRHARPCVCLTDSPSGYSVERYGRAFGENGKLLPGMHYELMHDGVNGDAGAWQLGFETDSLGNVIGNEWRCEDND